VATKEEKRTSTKSEIDLPTQLADLKEKVGKEKLDAFSRGLAWLEIGRIQRILEDWVDSIDAFKQAHRCFRSGKTDEAKANAVLARAGEALTLVMRDEADDVGRAARILSSLTTDPVPQVSPVVNHYRGLVAFKRGDRQDARSHLQAAVKSARRFGDSAEEAVALDSLSDFYRYYGEAGRSEAYLFKALDIKRQLRDTHGQAVTLGLLGRLCLDLERYPSAEHYLEENLTLARNLGDTTRVVRAMGDIGKAMVGQGKLDQADRKLKMGLMFAKRGEGPTREADFLRDLAEVARRTGKMAEARKRLDLASRSYLDAAKPEGAAVADCVRANIHFEEGDPKAAYTLLESATTVLRKRERPKELVPALGLMAQVKREVGDRRHAIAILKEATEAARKHHRFRELETLEREKFRLEHARPDSGGEENSLRFFREFCLHGLRGTVKEYRVVREIGQGRTGVVFEAYDEPLARAVAVKMLATELSRDTELTSRFRRELEAVGLVDHPGVMTVYACGRNDDRFFYVTDCLSGPSLGVHLDKKGPMTSARAMPLMARIADALAAVHAVGVVHRDLKPANILFDRAKKPVIVDFGITGKRVKIRSTEEGASFSSMHYRSPEQMNVRSGAAFEWDIFALGVTFYEMLTGRHPYPAKTYAERVRKLKGGKIAPVRANGKAPPAAVKSLITRMLSRDPKERPPAADIAEALAAYL
jgi:tetratricopeptide (TPR) repeat protein